MDEPAAPGRFYYCRRILITSDRNDDGGKEMIPETLYPHQWLWKKRAEIMGIMIALGGVIIADIIIFLVASPIGTEPAKEGYHAGNLAMLILLIGLILTIIGYLGTYHNIFKKRGDVIS